VNQTE